MLKKLREKKKLQKANIIFTFRLAYRKHIWKKKKNRKDIVLAGLTFSLDRKIIRLDREMRKYLREFRYCRRQLLTLFPKEFDAFSQWESLRRIETKLDELTSLEEGDEGTDKKTEKRRGVSASKIKKQDFQHSSVDPSVYCFLSSPHRRQRFAYDSNIYIYISTTRFLQMLIIEATKLKHAKESSGKKK